jgi:hypothetical protein
MGDQAAGGDETASLLIDRLRILRIQHEQEAGCRVIFAGRASSLARLEHRMTFRAKTELGSASGEVMGEHEIKSLGPMATAAGANALFGVSIKKQRVALVAEPPAALRFRALGDIESQPYARTASSVGSSRRATALVFVVEEDRATFRARGPSFLAVLGTAR